MEMKVSLLIGHQPDPLSIKNPGRGVHKRDRSVSMRLALGEGFPSGQRDQTVNLTALPSKVRILL
ncbi:hypothetical protein ACK3YJ_15025, partial [Aeromonas caviae]|uniref:hypothetical protein n=2 Tax=Aeromonas TaxID=642 RepID=UPI00214F2364